MTAAVPDPRFRDQLRVWLHENVCPALDDESDTWGGDTCDDFADALMPTIAAEVEARVQAAAKQGAAEERGRWITALGVLAARHSLRWFALELRDRAAALVPAASEEGA